MADKQKREYHISERPSRLKDVVGQPAAVAALRAAAKSGVPHLMLFTGPSGCGKTTLARITARGALKCGRADLCEVNAAQDRGIDMVRSIQQRIGLSPIDGPVRVWIIDEAHALTSDAQGAFLKMLEEPPDHAYFMLATTDPQKLKNTVITRASVVEVRALSEQELEDLVTATHAKYSDTPLPDGIADAIAQAADGSARKALVLLQQVTGVEGGPGAMMEVITRADASRPAIELAQALMDDRCKWGTVANIIRKIEADPEAVRWLVLGYAGGCAVGGKNAKQASKDGPRVARAIRILDEFSEPYFNNKRAGLILSAYNVVNPPE